MWSVWIIQKKVNRIGLNFFSIGKEVIIRNILNTYNIKYAIIAYEIINFNPIASLVNILALKLGLSKTCVIVILAFVL
jgi:hypothetical protein